LTAQKTIEMAQSKNHASSFPRQVERGLALHISHNFLSVPNLFVNKLFLNRNLIFLNGEK